MTARRKDGLTVALVNNKGGVGKTTTAVNLAAGLSAAGENVLLVDLDAQGSASLSLGLSRPELKPGAAEVVLEGLNARKAIRTTAAGPDILPGDMALSSADLVLANVTGREAILAAALKPVREDYGFLILDCPPSLGLLTVNALTTADCYLVPVTPDYLALEGLVNLLSAVDRIREGIGKAADLLGILLTMADYRLNVTGEIRDMIRRHYGKKIFRTEVRGNVRLKEAPSFGKTIFEYDAGSTGAESYRQLTKEVLRRAAGTE